MGCPLVAEGPTCEATVGCSPAWESAAGEHASTASGSSESELRNSPQSTSSSGLDFCSVGGLEAGLLESLHRLQLEGVQLEDETGFCYLLRYLGDVQHDGSCLFESVAIALGGKESARSVRSRCVERFLALHADGLLPKDVDATIKGLYSPDTQLGWGVHLLQEHKLLLESSRVGEAEQAIADLEATGMDHTAAAETVFQDLCTPVQDVQSWVKYMRIDGGVENEFRIVTLRYVQEGLLSSDVEQQAAFGDDLALECLATEYQRDIYVVQAHGSDADSGAEGALFFLPHRPRHKVGGKRKPAHEPLFLLMKGTGWCGAGADHYQPLVAQRKALGEGAKAAYVL